MTTTESPAFDAMMAHHQTLAEEVARRVRNLRGSADAGAGHEPAAAELVAYLADEVLPHAIAEEHTVYRAAASVGELEATVGEMIAEHRELTSLIEQLAQTAEAQSALVRAEAIGTLFATHVEKENDLLLPPLRDDESVDLAELLVQMHRLTEAARQTTDADEDFTAPDTEAVLLSLLLDAADGLADAGQGDRACRLVAQSWATLRVPRPDLAVRVTAALHRMARAVTAEWVSFTNGAHSDAPGTDEVLDVRALAPAQRHETIFAAYVALGAGHGFVLVNDHDPKPLRYQFEAEHASEFTWDSIEAGPKVWRVRIGRPALPGAAPSDQGTAPAEESELDVRSLPHGQRHDTIFAAYDALGDGHGFVLVNDHDPKPLRYQFEAQHDGEFSWDYLEAGPKLWRVRIGRPAAAGQ
ncbi:MAG: DUF2249 domain-containing protein [Acidimicrobiales bacterium]